MRRKQAISGGKHRESWNGGHSFFLFFLCATKKNMPRFTALGAALAVMGVCALAAKQVTAFVPLSVCPSTRSMSSVPWPISPNRHQFDRAAVRHSTRAAARHRPGVAMALCGDGVEVVETAGEYEIRRAGLSVGGLGRCFLRSRDVLRLLQSRRQEEFDAQVLGPLDRVLDKLVPMENQLVEARAKYDETENEIFGSQVRALEVKLKPLQGIKEVLEKNKERGEKTMAAIQAAVETSQQRYMSEGLADVFLVGTGKNIQVQAGRNIGLTVDSEMTWTLSDTDGGLSLLGKWQPNSQVPDHPLAVDVPGLTKDVGGAMLVLCRIVLCCHGTFC